MVKVRVKILISRTRLPVLGTVCELSVDEAKKLVACGFAEYVNGAPAALEKEKHDELDKG